MQAQKEDFGFSPYNPFPLISFGKNFAEIESLSPRCSPEVITRVISAFQETAKAVNKGIEESEPYNNLSDLTEAITDFEGIWIEDCDPPVGYDGLIDQIVNCTQTIYQLIRNRLGQLHIEMRVSYPLFELQRPLIDYFAEMDRQVIPESIRMDWNEANECLLHHHCRSGVFMAYRAAEGMLRYTFWNVTGSVPDGQKRSVDILKELSDELGETLTDLVKQSLDRRNSLAHGDLEYSGITPETALIDLATTLTMIHCLVIFLKNRQKALRLAVSYDADLDTGTAIWLLKNYGGGIAKGEKGIVYYGSREKKISNWYSYHIGIDGVYARSPDHSISDRVLSDLVSASLIPSDEEKFRLEKFVSEIPPFIKDKKEDRNSIHFLIKKLTDCNKPNLYTSRIVDLVDILLKEQIALKDRTEVEQLQTRLVEIGWIENLE